MKTKPMPKPCEIDTEDFWSKVDKGPDCWIWTGAVNRLGYGRFCVGYFMFLAHRVSLFLNTGVDPGPALVLHRCDNPACVNPDHLFMGTHEDNMRDMVGKRRSTAGAANPKAKLSEQQAREIYESKAPRAEIAKRFGVSPATVGHIKRGYSWPHIHKGAG